eukprot:scaffold1381_cov64-Cylindrotheca_fusiformis.AAC.10
MLHHASVSAGAGAMGKMKTSSPTTSSSQVSSPPTYIPGQAVPKDVAARAREIAQSRNRVSARMTGNEEEERMVLSDPPIINYNDIQLGKLLGTGSYSSAHEVTSLRGRPLNTKSKKADHNNNNNKKLIFKQLKPQVQQNPLLFAACVADLLQEARILATMMMMNDDDDECRNILEIHGWSGPDMLQQYLQGNPTHHFLLLEQLTGGTLDTKLKQWTHQHNSLWYIIWEETHSVEYLETLQEKCRYIDSLVMAMDHLHSHHVLHRDLKPANIGFDAQGNLKVFDFDLARVLPAEKHPNTDDDRLYQMTAKVGSPRYMAPEVKQGKPYNLKADVYSFGIVLYQLLTLEVPLHDTIRDWSTHNKYIPNTWSMELRSALERTLLEDITKRPTMKEIRSLLLLVEKNRIAVAGGTDDSPTTPEKATSKDD